MLELRKFPTKTVDAAAVSFDLETSGRTFDSLNFRFDGTITNSDNTANYTYATYRFLGTPELTQAGEPLIRMAGVDWAYLSAYTNGCFPTYLDDAAAASAEDHVATARIKLSRLVPGAYVNANLVKAFFRGSSAALTAAGSTVSAASMTLRPLAEALEYNPPTTGFLRPQISQRSVSVASSDSNQQTVINIESDTVWAGIMLSSYDASAGTEADGLIKNVKISVTSPSRGTLEILDSDWGNLRGYCCDRSGLNSTDVANTAGTVICPLTDRRAANLGGALFIPAGSAITITLDSSGTAQTPYTDVSPASGDAVRVTNLAFTPVAGAGDGSVQIGQIGRAGAAGATPAAQTRNERNAQRRARRPRRGRTRRP